MSKIIEDKRKAIEEYCTKRCCDTCKIMTLYSPVTGHCFTNATDEEVNRNYDAIKDVIEEPTAQLEQIQEDADVIIKVKSNRKIDNISIYFKED